MESNELRFPKLLKQKQKELGLNNRDFAKHIGKDRAWLYYVYCVDINKAHKLAEQTIVHLNELLDIPLDAMLEYNMVVIKSRCS